MTILTRGTYTTDYGTTGDQYVDPVNGNDANSGTEASPKQTIAAAVTALGASGGVVKLRGGNYAGGITWSSITGTSGQGAVTLEAYGTEKPVIDCTVPITGAVQCDASDQTLLGAGYANFYKVTVPISEIPNGEPICLNLWAGDTKLELASTFSATENDPVFDDAALAWENMDNWQDCPRTLRAGTSLIDTLDHPEIGNMNSTQWGQALFASNRAATHIGYSRISAVSGTIATLTDKIAENTSTSTRWYQRALLINCATRMAAGKWMYSWDYAASTCTVYFGLPAGAALSDMRRSRYQHGIDFSSRDNVTVRGVDVRGPAYANWRTQTGNNDRQGAGYAGDPCNNLTFENCRVYAGAAFCQGYPQSGSNGDTQARTHVGGFAFKNSTNLSFIRCEVDRCTGHVGFSVTVSSNVLIQRCLVSKCSRELIWGQNSEFLIDDHNALVDGGYHPHANLFAGYTGGTILSLGSLFRNNKGYWAWQSNNSVALVGALMLDCPMWNNNNDHRKIVEQSSNGGSHTLRHDMMVLNCHTIPHKTKSTWTGDTLKISVSDGQTYQVFNNAVVGSTLTGVQNSANNFNVPSSDYTNLAGGDYSLTAGATMRSGASSDVSALITALKGVYTDSRIMWDVDAYGDAYTYNHLGALANFDNVGPATTESVKAGGSGGSADLTPSTSTFTVEVTVS